ncbi:helix-turn-helix domain-containing protein [Priestia abyssalis]|uniref:helix-turn-helix domain-containing protein n=1 Tax=Priestia abyssalis TaxID=1221450 RepID=UPI000995635F|nr:helix-turn-helix transcriptional regulator [Priestia abyssalis]
MERIGQNIKMYRELKKMTQTELALKARLGVSTITKFENGEKNPDRQTLLKISTVLDVPITELTGVQEEGIVHAEIDEELVELIHEIGIEKAKFILRKMKDLNEPQYLQLVRTVFEQKYEVAE